MSRKGKQFEVKIIDTEKISPNILEKILSINGIEESFIILCNDTLPLVNAFVEPDLLTILLKHPKINNCFEIKNSKGLGPIDIAEQKKIPLLKLFTSILDARATAIPVKPIPVKPIHVKPIPVTSISVPTAREIAIAKATTDAQAQRDAKAQAQVEQVAIAQAKALNSTV